MNENNTHSTERNQSRFSDKVAIVTGGSRGIGLATAKALVSEGARVLVMSRGAKALAAARAELDRQSQEAGYGPGRAESFCGDVSSAEDVEGAFNHLHACFGRCDILVNNAGWIKVAPVCSMPLEDWQQTLGINLTGAFLCSQKAMDSMASSGGGAIVNISSLGGIAATEKFPGFAAYSAAKAGIVGLTEAMAVEGKPIGVRVNALAPGAVDTAMLRAAAPGLKTTTKPEDIAETILFLADARASGCMNGSVIPVFSNG